MEPGPPSGLANPQGIWLWDGALGAYVSSTGSLTAFVSDTNMALVEEDELLGSRQLDMGNSGSKKGENHARC